MKTYKLNIEEPLCSWLEELCDIIKNKNNIELTVEELLTHLVSKGFSKILESLEF